MKSDECLLIDGVWWRPRASALAQAGDLYSGRWPGAIQHCAVLRSDVPKIHAKPGDYSVWTVDRGNNEAE